MISSALRARAQTLRVKAAALLEEAAALEAAAKHSEDPHCEGCGHTLSTHDDEGEVPPRKCLHFDLSGDCHCTEYVQSDVPMQTHRDTRR